MQTHAPPLGALRTSRPASCKLMTLCTSLRLMPTLAWPHDQPCLTPRPTCDSSSCSSGYCPASASAGTRPGQAAREPGCCAASSSSKHSHSRRSAGVGVGVGVCACEYIHRWVGTGVCQMHMCWMAGNLTHSAHGCSAGSMHAACKAQGSERFPQNILFRGESAVSIYLQ